MEAIETHLCPQSRLCPPLRYSTSTPNSNSHSSSKSTSNSSSKSRSNSAQSLDQALGLILAGNYSTHLPSDEVMIHTSTALLHFSHCILLKLISFVVRTPSLLSRVCYQKTKPNCFLSLLHGDHQILTTVGLHFNYILATFWLHSGYILATFWLHFG